MPDAENSYTIGVDVGGTKVYTILIDSKNQVLARSKKKSREGNPNIILDRITGTIAAVTESSNVPLDRVAGIGIGFPGPLNPDTGVVLEATNLPGWDHFPLADEVKKQTGRPAFLDNDVNLGTLGEALAGSGKGASNVIGIFLGTGVGGGIVLGKKLYHGTSGTAGEVGHMIIQHGGRKSPRGLFGTVEGLTSRVSVVDQLVEAISSGTKSSLSSIVKSGNRIRSRAIAKAYRDGDKLVVDTLHRTAEFVGVTVGSLINFLAPDVVVLGGGVMEAIPESILPIAKKVAKSIAVPGAWKHVQIVEAELGDDAGAMGGALLARQNVVCSPVGSPNS
jgi:glucokinase